MVINISVREFEIQRSKTFRLQMKPDLPISSHQVKARKDTQFQYCVLWFMVNKGVDHGRWERTNESVLISQ